MVQFGRQVEGQVGPGVGELGEGGLANWAGFVGWDWVDLSAVGATTCFAPASPKRALEVLLGTYRGRILKLTDVRPSVEEC